MAYAGKRYSNGFNGFVARLGDESGVPFGADGRGVGESGTVFEVRRDVSTRYVMANGRVIWISTPNKSGWQEAVAAIWAVELGLVTGEKPATDRQVSYIRDLAAAVGWMVPPPHRLSRRDASNLIDELLQAQRAQRDADLHGSEVHVSLEPASPVQWVVKKGGTQVGPASTDPKEAAERFATLVGKELSAGHRVSFTEKNAAGEVFLCGYYDAKGERYLT